MSKNDRIVRQGDRIRVINPHLFVRCGYPLTKESVKNEIITTEQKQSIHDLLKKFGIEKEIPLDHTRLFSRIENLDEDEAYDKVLDVLAGYVIRQHCWGGKERKMYTEHKPEFMDITGQVFDRKIVKTGTYKSGGTHYDYYNGGYDYDPPYLDNEKTHVILGCYTNFLSEVVPGGKKFFIEKCNVIKILTPDVSPQHLIAI